MKDKELRFGSIAREKAAEAVEAARHLCLCEEHLFQLGRDDLNVHHGVGHIVLFCNDTYYRRDIQYWAPRICDRPASAIGVGGSR